MAERETLAPCAIAPQTSLKPAGDITVSSFMPATEKRTIADSAEGSAEGGGGGNIGEELDANIGLVGAIAIGVGTMIAAGIFVLSGLAVSNVGTVAIVSFLIAAVIASFTAAAYGEFSSIYPESGGGYMYVANTFSETDLTYIMGGR